jgi:phosphatidylglycerophosphatase GEP4
MSSWFNISGTLSAFRLLRDPSVCLPQLTVPTFAQLPVPITIPASRQGEKDADIRAVVLDKDNCFAIPHSNEIFPDYQVRDHLHSAE